MDGYNEYKTKIIYISGKARNGKDTVAEILKEKLENRGDKVLIAHYGDLVKYVATTFFNWNGEKDEAGRSLLQYIGTDKMRTEYPMFWIDFLRRVISVFDGEWDYVIIPDARFPDEVSKRCANDKHIRIYRPDFDNGLTEEQKNHPSETALDGCYMNPHLRPDFVIFNDDTIDVLKKNVERYIEFL